MAKPAGMVSHPAYRQPNGTLTDAIFARQAARGEGRPWLLHRLDRETSGVVLFAKTEAARRALVRQFERHTIHKQYLALIVGTLTPATGEIDAPLLRDPSDRRRVIVSPDGQPALTCYRVLWTTPATTLDAPPPSTVSAVPTYSLVLAEPVTGRTHQIRAHLAARGAAILGDAPYRALAAERGAVAGATPIPYAVNAATPDHTHPPNGGDLPCAISAPRAMLHAWRLPCRYPASPRAPFVVTAPPPDELRALLCQLGLADTLESLIATPPVTNHHFIPGPTLPITRD